MDPTWIKQLSEFINSVGLPVALVCFGCFCIMKTAMAVWPVMKAWMHSVTERNRKLGENYEKGSQIMQAMANESINIQNASLALQRSNSDVLKSLASKKS